MIYIALLRGINVGGNNIISMPLLKKTFESLGLEHVRTYINSGNVIFSSPKKSPILTTAIESAIKKDFGITVNVVLRDLSHIKALIKKVPESWTNDTSMKTDIMFLWEEIDSKKILNQIIIKPDIDDVRYIPGTLLWNVSRKDITKSGLLRIIGTPLYKKMTIRNVNTLRKLEKLMSAVEE